MGAVRRHRAYWRTSRAVRDRAERGAGIAKSSVHKERESQPVAGGTHWCRVPSASALPGVQQVLQWAAMLLATMEHSCGVDVMFTLRDD